MHFTFEDSLGMGGEIKAFPSVLPLIQMFLKICLLKSVS